MLYFTNTKPPRGGSALADFPYHFEDIGETLRLCVSREHRFGTDAFLLADFARLHQGEEVCDLCAGCGIIPLLWFRPGRQPKRAYGVELLAQGVEQMQITVAANHLEGRFIPIHKDLGALGDEISPGSLDLVTCNPPYNALGTGIPAPGESRLTARHEVSCTLEGLCRAAARLLRFGGRLCICNRPERLPDAMEAMRRAGLEPKRLRFVQQRRDRAPWLFLLEGKKGGKPFLQVEAPLLIEREEGGFSDEVLAIYQKKRLDPQ